MAQAVPYLMFAWFPVVLVLFARLPRHRAVLVAFIAGVLFLPGLLDKKINADAPNPVPVPYAPLTKQNTICLAILVAAIVFDRKRLLAFRPRWVDVPMVAWCLCPYLSSLTNAAPPDETTPLYDGFSQSRAQTLLWGVPWFIGRLYFTDATRFRELLRGVVGGGLVYVPFCLIEARVSPQFHKWVYGFEQHDFIQAVRPDGYRPTVFMEHGIAVGMWLVAATLFAFWLWWHGHERRLTVGRQSWPLVAAVLVLLATTVVIKSTGALALGVLGAIVLIAARRVSVPLALGVLVAVCPLYILGRTEASKDATGWLRMKFSKWETEDEAELESLEKKAVQKPMLSWGWWTSEDVLRGIEDGANRDRAKSLEFRLINEDRLMERAAQKPWFGWGGWDRAAILVIEDPEEKPKDLVTADGLWILTLANRGYFGLAALYAAMLAPVLRLMVRHPWRAGVHASYAAPTVAAVFVTLYMIDNLSNAMFNPVYVLMAGGLAGWTPAAGLALPARRDAVNEASRARPAGRVLADRSGRARDFSRRG